MRGRPMRRFILWLAWKVDHVCHRVIEHFDPISDEQMRLVIGEVRGAFERAAAKVKARESKEEKTGRSKWLVEVWEHRQVSFEVEADDEEEAKKVAEDVYHNDDDLQHEMVSNDESVAYDEVKVLHRIGPATGIISGKENNGNQGEGN